VQSTFSGSFIQMLGKLKLLLKANKFNGYFMYNSFNFCFSVQFKILGIQDSKVLILSILVKLFMSRKLCIKMHRNEVYKLSFCQAQSPNLDL